MRKFIFTMWILIAAAVPALSLPVNGRVRITGRPAGANVPTIVYAENLGGGRAQPGQFDLAQRQKTFGQRVLVVPAGSTVNFPNEDLIFHNVFSLSRPGPFDLGLYRAGSSKSRVFSEPAAYRVFCNIHPQMAATILVVPTSYYVEADSSGSYRLDLPAGRYRVTAWSERSEPSSVEITVGSDVPELALDEAKFVATQHKNKFEQSYPKSAMR